MLQRLDLLPGTDEQQRVPDAERLPQVAVPQRRAPMPEPDTDSRYRVRNRASCTVRPTRGESGPTSASAMPSSCVRSVKKAPESGRVSSAYSAAAAAASQLRVEEIHQQHIAAPSSSPFEDGSRISTLRPWARSTASTFAPHFPRRSRVVERRAHER